MTASIFGPSQKYLEFSNCGFPAAPCPLPPSTSTRAFQFVDGRKRYKRDPAKMSTAQKFQFPLPPLPSFLPWPPSSRLLHSRVIRETENFARGRQAQPPWLTPKCVECTAGGLQPFSQYDAACQRQAALFNPFCCCMPLTLLSSALLLLLIVLPESFANAGNFRSPSVCLSAWLTSRIRPVIGCLCCGLLEKLELLQLEWQPL